MCGFSEKGLCQSETVGVVCLLAAPKICFRWPTVSADMSQRNKGAPQIDRWREREREREREERPRRRGPEREGGCS